MRRGMFLASTIREGRPVAGVEVGLRGQPRGNDHLMPLQLNVPVADRVRRHLHYRAAVQQLADRDKNGLVPNLEPNRVVRAEPEIAMRHAGGDRAPGDTNRPDIGWARVTPAVEVAMPKPDDPRQPAVLQRDDGFPHSQPLDRRLTADGQNARARAEARHRDVGVRAIRRGRELRGGETSRQQQIRRRRAGQRQRVRAEAGNRFAQVIQLDRVAKGEAADRLPPGELSKTAGNLPRRTRIE
jgi:hypothetical protein